MRRVLVMIMLLALVLNVGCNKQSDDKEQTTTTIITNQNIDEVTSPENQEDTTKVEDTEDITTEIEENTTSNENDSDETDQDLVEIDAYPSVTEPIEFDPALFDETVAEEVTDETVLSEIEDYLKDFYFNYYFADSLEEETGTVISQTMELFALSYIMQNENQELKFDGEAFKLYIPESHVKTTVAKFFHRNLDVNNTYEDLGIVYDKGMYSVVVEAGTWNVNLQVSKIVKMGDFSYRVTAIAIDKDFGVEREKIEAVIDETADGYLIVNYHVEVIENESETDTED